MTELEYFARNSKKYKLEKFKKEIKRSCDFFYIKVNLKERIKCQEVKTGKISSEQFCNIIKKTKNARKEIFIKQNNENEIFIFFQSKKIQDEIKGLKYSFEIEMDLLFPDFKIIKCRIDKEYFIKKIQKNWRINKSNRNLKKFQDLINKLGYYPDITRNDYIGYNTRKLMKSEYSEEEFEKFKNKCKI